MKKVNTFNTENETVHDLIKKGCSPCFFLNHGSDRLNRKVTNTELSPFQFTIGVVRRYEGNADLADIVIV